MAIAIANFMQNPMNSPFVIAYSARFLSRVKRSQSAAVCSGLSRFQPAMPNLSVELA